ncbi:unnamed protein product, partial [Didymodactylos carnosus]
GLLGNMDGDKLNDLIFPNGTLLSTTDSNEERIFEFGESWRTISANSLFYCRDSLQVHHNSSYLPSLTNNVNTSYLTPAQENHNTEL